ncbi:MAG TPA: rhodanese-like domain-containing protein [Paludibacter sp.]
MKIKVLLPAIVLILSSFIGIQAQNKIEVNSKQASTLLQKDKKLVVLDVRTAEEFNEGHIKGAVNIDIRQPDAFSRIDKLNRNAKYIVHCRTNHRSGIAVDHMIQSGFKNVYQMMDGFPGWEANKLPVQK